MLKNYFFDYLYISYSQYDLYVKNNNRLNSIKLQKGK